MTAIDYLVALTALALAGVHAYVGLTTGRRPFFVVAALFVLGVGFFLSRYWRAVVYVLAAVYATSLGIVWLLGDERVLAIDFLAGALGAVFVCLSIYLFFRDSERLS